MSIFNKVVNFGIKAEYESALVQKIKLTNILAVVLLGMMVVYSIIALLVVDGLAPYLIPGYLFYGSVLIFNYLGQHNWGRFTMAIAPAFVISILHSAIARPGEAWVESIYIFQICALILPWTLLDTREGLSMLVATSISLFSVLGFGYINELIVTEIDNSIFLTYWISLSVKAGGIGLLFFVAFFQQMLQHKTEDETRDLLKKLEDENQLALQREEESQRAMQKLEEAQKEERKRAWATEGIAEVSSLLRSGDELKLLCDKIISFVVKYLKANQGGLYIVNKDADVPYIELTSCYAFDRKKFLHKKIEVGEGIVGQAYLEKDHVYLKEVPGQFFQITSGLGDAPPNNLMVTPMMIEENVYGLFEIASFRIFEKHEIEFMMKLGETIANALNNIHINERTKKLLAESQGQAEELRAQEEEMRQNMEELSATQEEMKRSAEEQKRRDEKLQAELKSKVEQMHQQEEELRQTLDSMHKNQSELEKLKEELTALVDNMPGIVYQCLFDENFTMDYMSDYCEKILGYPAEDFIGNKNLSYADLIHPEDIDAVNRTIEDAIEHKSNFYIEYRMRHKNGSYKKVGEHGSTMLNQQGEIHHLQGLVFELKS